jgi:hypothetical protein
MVSSKTPPQTSEGCVSRIVLVVVAWLIDEGGRESTDLTPGTLVHWNTRQMTILFNNIKVKILGGSFTGQAASILEQDVGLMRRDAHGRQ